MRTEGRGEEEQRIEKTHDIIPRRAHLQLLRLRIEWFLSDAVRLGRVLSQLLHPTIVGVIV